MSFAPHLPPPSSSIAWHNKMHRLKTIALASVFGLFAGVSGAAVMLGWIWPAVGEGDTWAIVRGSGPSGRGGELEAAVSAELAERLVTVYRRASPFGAGNLSYFTAEDKAGEALIVGSDGWAVIPATVFPGAYAEWRAVDKRGAVYRAEKFLEDRRSGFLFFKLAPVETAASRRDSEQFKVAIFSEPPGYLEEVFVRQSGAWARAAVGAPRWLKRSAGYLDSAGLRGLSLPGAPPDGAWAVNRQGRVVGVVRETVLLPAEYVSRLLPRVLKGEKIIYPTLGAEGWYSAERPIVVNGETVDGFLVSKVVRRQTPFKPGDVLLELNGQLISPEKIWYTRGEGKAVVVKVLRGGKEIEVEAKIVEL